MNTYLAIKINWWRSLKYELKIDNNIFYKCILNAMNAAAIVKKQIIIIIISLLDRNEEVVFLGRCIRARCLH
jgi:hypothetical protein